MEGSTGRGKPFFVFFILHFFTSKILTHSHSHSIGNLEAACGETVYGHPSKINQTLYSFTTHDVTNFKHQSHLFLDGELLENFQRNVQKCRPATIFCYF